MLKQSAISDHELLELPWIEAVYESRRDDVAYRIHTNHSCVSVNRHFHEVDNLGYSIQGISQVGHNGLRLYIDDR